VNISSGTGPPG